MSIATIVENTLIPVSCTALTVMAHGNTTQLLSIVVPMPVMTVARAHIPTHPIPPPQNTAITAPPSTPRVLTAPPVLPMLVPPQRKATASLMEAGRTMTELSTAEPRPAPLAITAPTSTQTTL